MDPFVPSICLSSLAGALLFYAGGRLSPRAVQAPLPASPDAPAPGLEPQQPQQPLLPPPELEEARAARAHAEQQAAGAARACDEARTALGAERARATALRQELTAERDARARADAEAARDRKRLLEDAARMRAQATEAAEQLAALRSTARHEGGEAERARSLVAAMDARSTAAERRIGELTGELERTRGELAKTRAEREQVRGELGKALAERDQAWGELVKARAEREQARSELGKALAEREQARAALAAHEVAARDKPAGRADLAELQRQNVEVSMKLRALEQRAGEMTRKEAENAELRRRVEALALAAAEAEDLRTRLRDLEAQGYARRAFESLHDMDEAPVSEGKPELETSISLGLRDLCQREAGCHAAVLSDTRGLLVAAYGEAENRLELAAAASLLVSTADRLRELLPVGAVESMSVVDENDLVLRTRWLRWEDECLLLSTLGKAPPADDAAVLALRAQLFALIGAG